MNEEENIEHSREDGKSESPKDVNDAGYQLPETSNKQPETAINKSEIPKSEIETMEVHHHPIPQKAGEKKNFKDYFPE